MFVKNFAVDCAIFCKFSSCSQFEVLDQYGWGSDDFPESVVHSLKKMATMAGVKLEGDGWSRVGTQAPHPDASL